MLFNSLNFLVLFLPITLSISLLAPKRYLLFWITCISCAFYGLMGHWWFLLPMAATVLIDYFVGLQIANSDSVFRRKALLCVSLTANVGLLVFFKYSYFIFENGMLFKRLLTGSGELPTWSRYFAVLLPAGISFYTFQTLSYIIDVWNKRCPAERHFLRFTSFVTFFPHLVAGPLTRHNQLIPQLERIEKEGVRPRWQEGISLFALGLCKKVLIADQIAGIIDAKIGGVAHADLVTSWLLLLGYTFQIYFDFSGYSDMAIGLGRLWGVELPLNFNKPYAATDPSDFWRRWHITLSQWLRDYIYIPLGGSRAGSWRTDFNAMLTMCIGGFWHGANWTFIFWGFYHGLLLILHRHWQKPWDQLSVSARRTLMFFLAVVGWLPFRSENFRHLKEWTGGLLGRHGVLDFASYSTWQRDFLTLLAILPIAFLLSRTGETAVEISVRRRIAPSFQIGMGIATAAAIVLMSHSSYFLYFRF